MIDGFVEEYIEELRKLEKEKCRNMRENGVG
jgi:hypothetical protein